MSMVEPAPSNSPLSPHNWPEHKLRLVDVGGAGGLQPKWLQYIDRIIPVLFEPNPDEAEKLRETLRQRIDSG